MDFISPKDRSPQIQTWLCKFGFQHVAGLSYVVVSSRVSRKHECYFGIRKYFRIKSGYFICTKNQLWRLLIINENSD